MKHIYMYHLSVAYRYLMSTLSNLILQIAWEPLSCVGRQLIYKVGGWGEGRGSGLKSAFNLSRLCHRL